MTTNKSDALISIAMATYNGEEFLRIQLDSILQQTYPFIELVITDDGSSDSTISIIKEYQQKHANVFLYLNEKNIGISKTFEHSIQKCNGAYIALADQDDIWMTDKLSILLNAFEKEDAVYCDSVLVDENGHSLGINFKDTMNMRSYYSGAPFLLGNCVPGHTLLIKADFFKSILPFPVTVFYDRWTSFCAAAHNGIRFVDIPLVQYRQHNNNTIGIRKVQKNKKKYATQTVRQRFDAKLQELKTFATAPGISKETKDILEEMTTLFTMRPSLKRSIFFFKNINTILTIKKRPYFRQILYCLKMFFRPNY